MSNQLKVLKPILVVDTSGGSLPSDVEQMIKETANSLGYGYAEGKVEPCSGCGYFECVCTIRKAHKKDCQYRLAAETPISLPCEHGLDICGRCNCCNCGAIK